MQRNLLDEFNKGFEKKPTYKVLDPLTPEQQAAMYNESNTDSKMVVPSKEEVEFFTKEMDKIRDEDKVVDMNYSAMDPYDNEGKVFTKGNFVMGENELVEFKQDPEGPWTAAYPGFEVEPDYSKPADLFNKPVPASVNKKKPTTNPKPDVKYIASVDPARKDESEQPAVAIYGGLQRPSLIEVIKTVAGSYNTSIIEERIKVFLGIDPGKLGGLFGITEKGDVVHKSAIPLVGTDVDAKGLWEMLDGLNKRFNVCVVLEDVHSLHKMAANTNFSMGHTLGIIQGIVVASKLKLVMVQPKTWQKEIWIGKEIEYLPKKPDQKNPSIDTKLTSKKAAMMLFPGVDFRKSDRAKIPHDGICDACCLSEFGRRKNL